MNVGTMGTGEITTWFLSCWQETGNTCYAMYSRSKVKGEALKKKFHGEQVYTDIDCFLADEKLDVVYIASPNSLHFHHAKLALLANKHVILEKPFTSTLKECEELICLAKERKLFLMEGITVVDLPNLNLLPSVLPQIGKQHMVSCNMSKVSSKYSAFLKGEKPNVFQSAFSGGALMDLNVYHIHLLLFLFGKPQEVSYVANIVQGIDTSGCLTLKYSDFIAQGIAAKDSEACNFVEFQGEKGSIRIESAAATCSLIQVRLTNQEEKTYQLQDHVWTHIYYIRAFLKMVKDFDYEGRDHRLEHTRDVMDILCQARKDAGIIFEADS